MVTKTERELVATMLDGIVLKHQQSVLLYLYEVDEFIEYYGKKHILCRTELSKEKMYKETDNLRFSVVGLV